MHRSADQSERDDDQREDLGGIPGFPPGQSDPDRSRIRQTGTPPDELNRRHEPRKDSAAMNESKDSSDEKSRSPGRPQKHEEALSERMTVRLTASQMERIEQVAADMDVSPSVAAREIIGQKPIDQKARQLRRVRDQLSEIGAKVRGIDKWVRKATGDHADDIADRQKRILNIIYEKLKETTREL